MIFTYDVTGQQATASYSGYSLQQSYDGNGLRVKKTDNGTTTWYLRSTVLGGQVVAEINGSGAWQRGYVYAGSLLAVQQSAGVYWMHEDPVTKSKRVTNSTGTVVSTVELDPWGADTNRSSNGAFQPKKFTTYDRDGNGSDEAMFRRYNRSHSRFDQPDPYDGSNDFGNPQSFNRYAYVQNDPVNFTDPTGLQEGPPPPGPFDPSDIISIFTSAPKWPGSAGGSGRGIHDPLLETGTEEPGFGGNPLIPRPDSSTPNPNAKQNNNQRQGFENCAKGAWRGFRKGYLVESLRAVGGGGLLAGGIYVTIRGVPGGSPVGIIAAINAARSGELHGIEGAYRAGAYAGLSLGLLGAYMIGRSVQEQRKNIATREAALENCKKQFPNADHSMSFLNF